LGISSQAANQAIDRFYLINLKFPKLGLHGFDDNWLYLKCPMLSGRAHFRL
jgi:hypothetical protein